MQSICLFRIFSRKEVVVPVTGEYQEIYGTGSEVLAPLQTRVLKF